MVRKIMNRIKSKMQVEYQKRMWRKRIFAGEKNPIDCGKILEKYNDFIKTDINYVYEEADLPPQKEKHKWVGGQIYKNMFMLVPNDSSSILCVNEGKLNFVNVGVDNKFKWTGGCIWDAKFYCFPRTENSMLRYDIINETVKCIHLNSCDYKKEHHYGGVVTNDGIVYQPPRDSDHILEINLNNMEVKRIYLSNPILHFRFRYCGSVLHPNGYIYFLPEKNNKVIKFNPITKEISYIGDPITPMVFDAKVGPDGNIYGYSAYCAGILKIDVTRNSLKMIHTEIWPGAFGTKIGINGKLYSVPGDGKNVFEYDVINDRLRSIATVSENMTAKFAGGATVRDGKIFFSTAESGKMAILRPEKLATDIDEELYTVIYMDCY